MKNKVCLKRVTVGTCSQNVCNVNARSLLFANVILKCSFLFMFELQFKRQLVFSSCMKLKTTFVTHKDVIGIGAHLFCNRKDRTISKEATYNHLVQNITCKKSFLLLNEMQCWTTSSAWTRFPVRKKMMKLLVLGLPSTSCLQVSK